jgi:hypothetical protein
MGRTTNGRVKGFRRMTGRRLFAQPGAGEKLEAQFRRRLI